jgi:hypothetical protein
MASLKIFNKGKCAIQGRFQAKAILSGYDDGVKTPYLIAFMDFFCIIYWNMIKPHFGDLSVNDKYLHCNWTRISVKLVNATYFKHSLENSLYKVR